MFLSPKRLRKRAEKMLIYLRQMYRLTIRATDDTVPPILMKLMEVRLAAGEAPFYPP